LRPGGRKGVGSLFSPECLPLAIEEVLDEGLPRAYSPEIYQQKCSAVFEHFYETYGDRGVSIYQMAG